MYSWLDGDCLFDVPPAANYSIICGTANGAAYQAKMISDLTKPFGGAFQSFNRLYLQFNASFLTTKTAQVAAFITQLTNVGIAVEYLDGQPWWVANYTARTIPMVECADIVAYNSAVPPAARFTGMMLDIEPNANGAAWHTNDTTGVDPYNSFFEANFLAIFEQCKTTLAGTGTSLAFSVGDDYYHYVPSIWGPLIASPFADYVLICAFYNNAQSFWYTGVGGIGGVANVLASLVGSSIQAVFSLDFMSTTFVLPPATMWPNGTMPGATLLANTTSLFANHPNFLGISAHYYTPFYQLGLTGPIVAPSTPVCTVQGFTITVTGNPYYFECAEPYYYSSHSYVWTKSRVNITLTPSTYTFVNSGPYEVVFFDGPGCAITDYLPQTVACS